MIIFYPDKDGLFNNAVLNIYSKNTEKDFYTAWDGFDSFLYGDGLYELRTKQYNPKITDSDLSKKVEMKKEEFSLIEKHLEKNKIKWLIEREGLNNFATKGFLNEYNVKNIPVNFRKETIKKAISILESYPNYEIAIYKGKLPFFYTGAKNSGVLLMRKEHRESTLITGFYSEDTQDCSDMISKFNEYWGKSINDRGKVIKILKNY